MMNSNDIPLPPLVPKKRNRSLTQEVVAELSRLIQSGTWKPGDKLPTESAIMQTQAVSRTVVREAISRLQAAGLVETRHGIGTFVLDPASANQFRIDTSTITTIQDVLSLLELRISLETEAAGLAASRRNNEELALMRKALDDFQQNLAQGSDPVTADFQFHMNIARATGNRYFVEFMTYLGSTIIPRTRLNTAQLNRDKQTVYLERVQREHESIYQAIEQQDSEAARSAMRLHLSNSRERLQKAQQQATGHAS